MGREERGRAREIAVNYVFFDIECANCIEGQAKICSFGYVVTDEHFQILEKEDLIVNPKAPFLLTGRKNRPFIQLAYSKTEFKKAPTFPYVYDRIKELLTRPDTLVFGYAADNDANYLRSEFERYCLPCVNFSYCDLQKAYHFIETPGEQSRQVSLSDAAAMYMGEVNQEVHKSDDDAYFTMRVLEGLCAKTGKSPAQLVEEYPSCSARLFDGKVYIRVLEGSTLLERILGDKSDRIAPKSVNRTLYLRYIRHVKPSERVCKQVLKGKRVAIPEKFAERHYRHTMKLISLICDHGGRYYISPSDCNLFINYPVYHDDGTLKTNPEIARLQQKRGIFRVKIHTPESFLALLSMTPEEFEAMEMPDVSYLLDEKYAPRVNAAGEKSERQKPVKKNRTVL